MEGIKAKKSGLEFEVPDGWNVERLDTLAEIQQGISKGKKFKGIETVFHPYLRVANVKDGYFDLSEIKNIETPVSDLDRYAVLEKDILITEGGDPDKLGRGSIWMGEFQRPVFQNHLFRIRSKKSMLEPWYLFNYLQSRKAKTYFLNSAKQTTGIASINSSQVKETPVLLPPLPEQRAIAQVLGTMDKVIQTTERLIGQKELRKKWLMQQLLTGKVRLRSKDGKQFEAKWEDVELGELLSYEQPTKYLVKDTLYNDSFETPVLTVGKTFILGYTNESEGLYDKGQVIIFDDFTTASRFIDFPFKIKSSAIKLLTTQNGANLKFVFESMQILKYGIGGHERHWISKFVYLTIPCPSREEQTAIASVLQTADQEISLLKAKAEKLREQKKGMMQVLLTGKVRLKIN